MYLHLGSDVVVSGDDVIAIFDLDTSSISKDTRRFLEKAQKDGRVTDVSEELPRSFVVVGDKKDFRLYVSPISSHTLVKRQTVINNL